MNKAFLLLLFLVLICWGSEKQHPLLAQKTDASFSAVQAQLGDILSDSIRVSFFIIPPHIFLDENKKICGAVYELIENHIAPEINMKFQWDASPTSLPRQLYNLKQGKKYIACFLVFVPKRREYIIYSKTPYYYAQSIIAVHNDNPLMEVKTAEDIRHMVFGYSKNIYRTPFMRDPSIHFELLQTPDFLKINLQKVINHRIDGIYSPGKASSLFYLQKFGLLHAFRLIDLPEKPSRLHIGFPRNLKALAEKFDRAFEKIGGQQLYLKLLSQYIDVSKLKHVSTPP